MLSKNAERINESLQRLRRYSGYIQKGFKVVLVSYLVLVSLFLCYALYSLLISDVTFEDLCWMGVQFCPALFSIVITVLIFTALIRIFGDMFSGDSPFTSVQSQRLKHIGFLLLALVVFEALASAVPMPFAHIGPLTLGLTASGSASASINFSAILGSVVSFCLSFVFKHCALLQQLSDDTV